MKHNTMTIIGLAAGIALCAGQGNQDNPRVIPPDANAHGMSCSQWADAWWQWGWSFSQDINPVLDPTGENAAQGQSGSIWFLAGTLGWEAERTVTVPCGKSMLIPVVYSAWINLPALGDAPWSPEQEVFARAYTAGAIDEVVAVFCTIDGAAVQNLPAYRCQTPLGEAFMISIPENDIMGVVGLPTVDGGTFQAGTYGPAVQDGIYLMLPPLPVGQHEIRFGSLALSGWDMDVTYHMTVQR